jgi:prevent-host-death family protein
VKIEIGAYEAKTRLPELLRGVRAGKRYTITNRGVAVADLVPAESARHHEAAEAVEEMKTFMAKNPIKGVDIKGLIEEGRA